MYYFVAFMTFTLVLLWLCQVVFFDRIYKTMMINDIEGQAQTLVSTESSIAFSSNAAAMCENSRACIIMYSHDNQTAYNLSDIDYKDCYLYRLKINQLVTL